MGLLIASCASLQFIIGGLLVILFNLFGYKLFPTFGFLVAMGFEEGPGQALSIGKSWEGFGFTNAATIGLSFATLGFIFAIFLGVPLVSWAIRKGYTYVLGKDLPQAFKTGIFPKEQQKESAGTLTTHPATMDTLTFHAALIGLVYVLTYFFVKMLELVTPADIAEMYWGFFFIWGLLIAFLARTVIEKIGAGYMLDARIQGRITGWSVDFLIVASITAVSLAVAWKFVVPILAMAVAAGVITLLWVLYFGKRIWEDYNFERTAGVYGMETGTVATGLILIRIADPSFCTPAATDLALSSIVALPILFVMFHLMNAPILLGWSTGLTVLVFALFMVAILVFLRVFRLWKTPKS
jgi:ESS family glutamate:Na+ symporter